VIITKLSSLNASECFDELNNYRWNGLCFHFIQWLAFLHLSENIRDSLYDVSKPSDSST